MKIKTIVCIAFLALATGCGDAEQAKDDSMAKPHKITVYSGGQAVKVFHSSEGVESEYSGGGAYYFKDKETGKLVRVAGTVIVEQE